MAAKMASLDQYTFDLRAGLRDAARVGLGQLEEMITELGYGWLDSHMDGIMERTSRGPITELMKTPSRTQTVKKTRAVTTAMKERTDKVNKLNTFNGSPLSKASPARAPLSPLQPRSMNAPAVIFSPSPLKTSSKSTSRSQPSRPTPRKDASAIQGKVGTLVVPSPSRRGPAHARDVDMLSPTPTKQAAKSVQSPRHVRLASRSPSKSTKRAGAKSYPSAMSTQTPAANAHRSITDETRRGAIRDEAPEVPGAEVEETVIGDRASMATAPMSDPLLPATQDVARPGSPISGPAATSGPSKLSQAQVLPPSQPVAPAQPIRQVRSSWLSKALGTTVVAAPLTSQSADLAGLRKSYASSSHKINGPIDLTNIRKSLAPAGVLAPAHQVAGSKRPSDTADEKERPEKVSKVEKPAVVELDKATSLTASGPRPVPPTVSATSHTPGPSSVIQPPSTSSIEDTRPSQPMTQMRERQRSDIHKVTKALDELRERNAAKEAHKTQAALAASGSGKGPRTTSSSAHDRQSAAGSGFLRNLGNLGAGLGRSLGLGGTVKSAEEEAQRLAEELEEDRRAEAEAQQQLAKLMAEVEGEGVTTADEEMKGEKEPELKPDPVAEQSAKAEVIADGTNAGTEKEDEDMIVSALGDGPVRPSSPVRPPTPAKAAAPVQVTAQQTPPKAPTADVFESTTPLFSPVRPVRLWTAVELEDRSAANPLGKVPQVKPKHTGVSVQVEQVKRKFEVEKVAPAQPARGEVKQPEADPDESMEEDVKLPELPAPTEAGDEGSDSDVDIEVEEADARDLPAKKMFKSDAGEVPSRLPTSSSSGSLASTLGQSTSSNINHASMIGGKMLGFKPVVGHVKSLSQANAALKKTQNDVERRNQMREQNEAKRAEIARKKLEEEKQAAEIERKAKLAEQERIRKNRLALEKSRKEREEKAAAVAREKAAKEEAERIAAKAKADDEARKRKAAQAAILAKSASNASKAGPSVVAAKAKEPIRAVKPGSTIGSDGHKLGAAALRTIEVTQTVTLVPPRGTLGPPSRPSQLATQSQNAFLPYPPHLAHGSNGARQPSTVLQQSRTQLQAQLDEKAAEIQSEDIVLPDIASEYSDSDDSDKETEFQRPQWAESPDLRAALEAQATRNPDEIFGPIKPLNMEELFKIRTNKFRARTSSANWNGGDRLTRAEEVEYARRMGFKPIGSSTQGQGQQQ